MNLIYHGFSNHGKSASRLLASAKDTMTGRVLLAPPSLATLALGLGLGLLVLLVLASTSLAPSGAAAAA